MGVDSIQQHQDDFEKITTQLHDVQHYLKEIKIYHCLDVLIFAGLVAVALQTCTYLLYGPILTDFDKALYMFSLLVGPSAFFLFLLHLYDLYGFLKKGEKSIPLTLDFTYFIYFSMSFVTMIGLHLYYQQHNISPGVLTPGWTIAVFLLFGQVLLALFCATYVVTIFISRKLPHFFEHPKNKRHKRPLPLQRHFVKQLIKPKQMYYFRKKPDVSLWQNEEYFVRYK
jgi:hypothetical protein